MRGCATGAAIADAASVTMPWTSSAASTKWAAGRCSM
jgi:hypothetical protein